MPGRARRAPFAPPAPRAFLCGPHAQRPPPSAPLPLALQRLSPGAPPTFLVVSSTHAPLTRSLFFRAVSSTSDPIARSHCLTPLPLVPPRTLLRRFALHPLASPCTLSPPRPAPRRAPSVHPAIHLRRVHVPFLSCPFSFRATCLRPASRLPLASADHFCETTQQLAFFVASPPPSPRGENLAAPRVPSSLSFPIAPRSLLRSPTAEHFCAPVPRLFFILLLPIRSPPAGTIPSRRGRHHRPDDCAATHRTGARFHDAISRAAIPRSSNCSGGTLEQPRAIAARISQKPSHGPNELWREAAPLRGQRNEDTERNAGITSFWGDLAMPGTPAKATTRAAAVE